VYRDALERIVAQAADMGRLVDDLLFLARAETDTIRFEPKRVALQDVVAQAVREAAVLGQQKRIEIETAADPPPGPVWVEADAGRLKQALMILLDNAIKYSPPGRSVRVGVAATEDGRCEVAVRDEGAGIPATELSHVFERFYRGHVPGASGPGGSGLGLAIAKWLVEKHGGEVVIESEEGRFTEVRMRLPRAGTGARDEDPAGRGRSPDRQLRQARA
jgi:signal transduction histidine kinase